MTILEKIENIKGQKDQYLLPENLKKDITLLNVTGTLDGGIGAVKLFNNQTQMQADTTAQEGDLAVVYRSDISTPQPGDSTSVLYFLDNVIFSNPIDTYYDGMIRSDNLYMRISLSPSYCYFEDWSGTIPEIYYSSNDGITYVREDQNESHYELEQPVTLSLDEHILQFMQSNTNIFEGLFQSQVVDNTQQPLFIDISRSANLYSEIVYTDSWYSLPNLTGYQYYAIVATRFSDNLLLDFKVYKSDKELEIGQTANGNQKFIDYGVYGKNIPLDVDTYQNGILVSSSQMQLSQMTAVYSTSNNHYVPEFLMPSKIAWTSSTQGINWSTSKTLPSSDSLSGGGFSVNHKYNPIQKYVIAPSQLNSLQSNLYEGVIGYGKEGVTTGDGSIREKFTIHDVLLSDYNIDTKSIGGISHYVTPDIPADICKLTSRQ